MVSKTGHKSKSDGPFKLQQQQHVSAAQKILGFSTRLPLDIQSETGKDIATPCANMYAAIRQ